MVHNCVTQWLALVVNHVMVKQGSASRMGDHPGFNGEAIHRCFKNNKPTVILPYS